MGVPVRQFFFSKQKSRVYTRQSVTVPEIFLRYWYLFSVKKISGSSLKNVYFDVFSTVFVFVFVFVWTARSKSHAFYQDKI